MATYPPFMPGLPGVQLFNEFSGLYRPTASNADLDRLYSTSVAIYAAANFWGETASLVKWKVLDQNKQEVPLSVPEVHALRHTMPDIMHRSMISEKFRGYNLLYKEPGLNGHTYRLRWMNFNIYQLDEHFQEGLRGFRVNASGTNYEPVDTLYIHRSEAIYWNLIDLRDDFDGVSAAEVAFMYAGVDVEAGTTMLAYFQNMAIPALFIQPAENSRSIPSEREADDLRTMFRKIVRGAMNFGRTIISPARWEIEQVQSKMEDLKMGELIATAREGVRIAMNVPKFVVSSEGTSYAESYEERRQWLNLSFVPHMNKIARYFEDQLIRPRYPGWTVEADFSDVPGMKEEAERLTTTITAQINSVTRDLFSAQEALGIEPQPELKNIFMVQGVPVPLDKIPTFYATMQAQLAQAAPTPFTSPGFGGSAPAPSISAGDNAQGAAPSAPVGTASKESGQSACLMLHIGAHPDLIALQRRVQEICQGGVVEWNAPDTFHVTLVSLPSVDEAQVALLRAYASTLVIPPLPLRIGSLGTFDNLGNYAIRFLIRANETLYDLQEACVDFCEQNGIAVSHYAQAYKPHITMGYSTFNPGRLTYNTPLTVTPQALHLSVGDTVVTDRPLGATAQKSTAVDTHAGHDHGPVEADKIWLDDAEFRELKNWTLLMGRKGINYEFKTNVLPADSITFGRTLLAQGYSLEAAAEAMKAHIISVKKKTLVTPDGEEVAYDAWSDYDRLKKDIGDAWLEQYQRRVLDHLLSRVTDDGVPLTALDTAFERSQDDLIDLWTGTDADPGPLSRLFLAGVAAGDASLRQGSAANPLRPVALKAVSVGVDWSLTNEEAVAFVRRYAADLLRMLDRTTMERVKEVIAQWQDGDLPASMLRQLLTEVILDPSRAASVSQTESTRAYFEGARERYRQADVKTIQWRTVNVGLKRIDKQPGDVCPLCTPLHDKTGPLDKGVWSDQLQSWVTPPLHRRCRCWVVAADEDMR